MINKLKSKSEFSRNVLTLMTGTTIAQAIPIAISPILTRIYTPEDFGVFALFIAIASIFGSIVNGRYELAIMLPKKDEDAINIFALGFIITITLSIFLLSLVVIFHNYFITILNNKEIGNWLYFMPIAVLFMGLFNLLNYFNNRKKYYKDIANAIIIKSIILATVQLSMGLLKQGLAGLISGQILSQIFANMRLFKNIIQDKRLISKISKVKIIALAKKYKKFPIYNTQHALINIVFSRMPIFILSKFFDASTIGFYSLSIRIVQTPITIIGNAFANVLYQKIVHKRNNGQKYINQIFKFLKTQIMLAVLLFIVIFILSNYIGIIFGESWSEVGLYIKLLMPWLFMVFIVSPLAFSINMTNNQEKGLYLEWIYGGIKLASLLVGALYFKNVEKTLILFSVANSLFLLYQANWFINLLKEEEL